MALHPYTFEFYMKGEVIAVNRYVLVLISVLFFAVMVPAFAQEDTEEAFSADADPCSAGSIIERVDTSYTEFQVTRSADDSLATYNEVENFYNTIGDILDECRNIVELAASGVIEVGSGTFDDPYAFDYFGDTSQGYLLKISNIVRPADQYRHSWDDAAPQGWEYVALVADLQCVAPEGDFCEIGYSDFELTGDNGTVYDYVSYSSSLDLKLRPGGEGSGSVWFLVQNDDSNLLAMFEEGYRTGLVVFRAEPAPGQVIERDSSDVTVTATTNMNVRGGPGTSYRVVGSFQNGQHAVAVGRNSAGTWVQMESGWVFAQLVRVDGDITSLPVTG